MTCHYDTSMAFRAMRRIDTLSTPYKHLAHTSLAWCHKDIDPAIPAGYHKVRHNYPILPLESYGQRQQKPGLIQRSTSCPNRRDPAGTFPERLGYGKKILQDNACALSTATVPMYGKTSDWKPKQESRRDQQAAGLPLPVAKYPPWGFIPPSTM